MYSAPAVFYPVGRSRFHGWMLGLVSLTGAFAGLLWRLQADTAVWKQVLFLVILFGTCLTAVWAWRVSPRGSLQWDGQSWSLTLPAASLVGVLTVHLDLQWCLLLCLHSENGRRDWLWVERWRDLASWNALRRAVFAAGTSGEASRVGVGDHRGQVQVENER
jgi:hypothetical protein